MRRRGTLWVIGVLMVGLSGCGLWQDAPPTITPIYVTITPELVVVPIVATETPAVTSVLYATDVSMLPTPGATRTPTATWAKPITMTPSFTPTATDTPATPGAVALYAPVGGAGVGGGSCATLPQGGFGNVYQSDPNIPAAIGCPLSNAAFTVDSAYQTFQNGIMFWLSSLGEQAQPVIYALYNNGTYQRFNDTFQSGVDPENGGASPPGGMQEPVRGFGKVWRDNLGVRDTLGWATSGETAGSARLQLFERGEMAYISQTGQTYILITGAPGTWTALTGGP